MGEWHFKVDSQIIITAHMQFGKFFIIYMNLHKSLKLLTYLCPKRLFLPSH